MDQLLDPFFSAVMHEWVPWTLAGLIVVYASVEYLRLKTLLSPIAASLRMALAGLRLIPDQRALVEQYEAVNAQLSKDPWLGATWRKLAETFILPDSAGLPVRNTVRPSLYFTTAGLAQGRLNMRYFQAIPNILVGLGLLFTFIGLIAALFFAAKGVASQSVQEAQLALKELLSAATFKFVTSVAGLGASIAFSISIKRTLYDFAQNVAEFCQALEARLDFISPAAVADQSHRELQSQTRELQKFNTDLAFSIAEAMDNRLSESLARVMAPMAEALDRMAGRFGEMNQEALERMISRFSQSLEGAAGKQIEALVTGMKDVQGGLSALVGDVARINSDLTRTIADSAEGLKRQVWDAADGMGARLTSAASALEEQLGAAAESIATRLDLAGQALEASIAHAVNALSTALSPVAEQLSHLGGTLGEIDAQFGRRQETLTALNRELEAMVARVSSAIDSLGSAASPLTSVSEAFERTAGSLSAAGSASERALTASEELARAMRQTGEEAAAAWTSYRTHFESLDQTLSNLFSEINAGLARYQEQVAIFVVKIDESMDRSVKLLGGAVQELNGSVDELGEVLRRSHVSDLSTAEAAE